MRQAVLLAAALCLVGCQTPRGAIVAPVRDPCPPEAAAPLQAAPETPEPDPVEMGRIYGILARGIGDDRAQALVRFWEVELPSYAGRGWQRAAQVKAWCDVRDR